MNTAFLNAKNDFLAAAKRTYESGIQTGTGGNLSVRIPGENLMIVKPSGFSYGQCTEDNLCITDFDGNVVMGGKPTRESTLHGNLYKRYPQSFLLVNKVIYFLFHFGFLCNFTCLFL